MFVCSDHGWPALMVATTRCFGCLGMSGSSNVTDAGDFEESQDDLTQRSDALVLAAANTLDEDVLDRDVGLGPDDAHAITTRRPFSRIESLKAILSPSWIRMLLIYAGENGVQTELYDPDAPTFVSSRSYPESLTLVVGGAR